jgi:23S rRNA (uracil1939-C5)-methyltransferase
VARIALDITSLGRRGEGIARGPAGSIFVPYALPGELVEADVNGAQATLVALQQASPERVSPPCPHYGDCGGCALQHLADAPYEQWKRSLVISQLTNVGLSPLVQPLFAAHGRGRRRVTFHVRRPTEGKASVGFMGFDSHRLVEIGHCLVCAPELGQALPAARALASVLIGGTASFDIHFTATASGLDCDVRGLSRDQEPSHADIAAISSRFGLIRLSINGIPAVTLGQPLIDCAGAKIILPPSPFLQATELGETTLLNFILAHLGSAKRAADLFCGVGTFTFHLARQLPVLAVDRNSAAIDVLMHAARHTQRLKSVRATVRDLFRQPLTAHELDDLDFVVFDPPRQGAEAQSKELAQSRIPSIVAISCNPSTFARDAAILVGGGYELKEVLPIDQFRWSAHVEIAAFFTRGSKRGQLTLRH